MIQRVVAVSPRGFCAGVVRAIAAAEQALATFPPPVYVRRAIVHNARVVARLEAAGAIFVQELDEVPCGSVVVFSAHGVSEAVREQARGRGLRVVDATCPLVAKVHREVKRFARLGFDVLLIGHAGHDEVEGTLGQVPGVHLVEPRSNPATIPVSDPDRVACVTQTTLSALDVAPVVSDLRRRFPLLAEPAVADICFATQNRQAAIAAVARNVDVVLVVGDRTSSNSNRLVEVASAAGTPAYLITGLADLREGWLEGVQVVAVSAGASTPEHLVVDVLDHFGRAGAVIEHEAFVDEDVSFRLPPEVGGTRVERTHDGDAEPSPTAATGG